MKGFHCSLSLAFEGLWELHGSMKGGSATCSGWTSESFVARRTSNLSSSIAMAELSFAMKFIVP
jgi:hypothetical protein